MNVFQFIDALDSALIAHAQGKISNENLSQVNVELEFLFKAQPEDAQLGNMIDQPRIVGVLERKFAINQESRMEAVRCVMFILDMPDYQAIEVVDDIVERAQKEAIAKGVPNLSVKLIHDPINDCLIMIDTCYYVF